MTTFRFVPITPHHLLRPFVSKIHVFESSGRLPAQDVKLIVPNGSLKLTLTYMNGIIANIAGKTFVQNEHALSLTGLIDKPVALDSKEDVQTGTVIIEFNALGAYRLFRMHYAEIANKIVDLEELLGISVKHLKIQLTDTQDVNGKVQLLQQFLIHRLHNTASDQIYDFCVGRIIGTSGTISVAKLEKETGYSARWLHNKFSEHLGTGAKNLSEIVRFKQFYEAYSTGAPWQQLKHNIYGFYHDQSHFIRSFKRFTGFTPTDLQNSVNELAIKHYIT